MKPQLMSSSNQQLEELESDPYSVAQTIALMALGRRAKSRGELLTLLKKRGIEEEVANAVLFRLQEQGFINDYEFARYWSESRQRTKKVSKRIIAGELRSKGIADEIIEAISLMTPSLPMRCSLQSANPVQFEPLLQRLPIEECMELYQDGASQEISSIEFSQS
jgi:hypothetical protein